MQEILCLVYTSHTQNFCGFRETQDMYNFILSVHPEADDMLHEVCSGMSLNHPMLLLSYFLCVPPVSDDMRRSCLADWHQSIPGHADVLKSREQ